MARRSSLFVAVTAVLAATLLPGSVPGALAFQGPLAPQLAWRAAGSVCGQARGCAARVGNAAARRGVQLPAFALRMAGQEDEEKEVDPRTVYMPADDNASVQSAFARYGLIPELCDALTQMGIVEPTNIQAQSLPVSLAGESVLLCAETGSGKSFSFLLPAVNRLKIDETSRGMRTRPKRPRALILAPTRELGAQLLSVAKSLSGTAKFSSMGLLGGSPPGEQMKRLERGVDLVVATTGRLRDFVKDGHIRLSDVRFIAADEADTMASQGFADDLKFVFSAVAAASNAAKESYEKYSVVHSAG
ncbi:P-loop containing nucleoside triphosphate hydrolase protein [Baffinella frigidus]|nr:P-loop containing nucleoside triphosphate hydrolase protein [Cryptophyta sp. CCMP2293]